VRRSTFPELLARPVDFADGPAADQWFCRIADRLLNGCRLIVGDKRHRLVEVEVYYHGPGHADVFAHRDPVQLHPGQWYFHRSRGQYRGGSFKGIDLSFGGPTAAGPAYGGVLVRGLTDEADLRIDGPSLLVDYLLLNAGHGSVAALDAAIGHRLAWDESNPVQIEDLPVRENRQVLRTARVGLSLRRAKPGGPALGFLTRPYRFLTEPRTTAKGRPHIVLAMLGREESVERIRELTGVVPASIRRYAAEFEAGKRETDATGYFGRELSTRDMCRLSGMSWASSSK
jgi:hypothetical protein